MKRKNKQVPKKVQRVMLKQTTRLKRTILIVQINQINQIPLINRIVSSSNSTNSLNNSSSSVSKPSHEHVYNIPVTQKVHHDAVTKQKQLRS